MSSFTLTSNFWGSNVIRFSTVFKMQIYLQRLWVQCLLLSCNKCVNSKIKVCWCPNPNGLQEHNCRKTQLLHTTPLKCQMMIYNPHKQPTHENTKKRSKYQTSGQKITWAALTLFSKSISSFSFPMRSSLSWWAFSNLAFSWRSLASSWKHTHKSATWLHEWWIFSSDEIGKMEHCCLKGKTQN